MTQYVLYSTEVTSLALTDSLSERFYRLTMLQSAILLPMLSPSLSPLTMAGAVEKQVQKQGAKPTYAQTVQKTIGQEIPVSTRIHNEVTIRPGLQTGQLANRTPAQLMEALKNQAPLSCQKDIRAVRKLPSGNIIISLETPQAKAQLESNKEWISTVFTAEAKLSP